MNARSWKDAKYNKAKRKADEYTKLDDDLIAAILNDPLISCEQLAERFGVQNTKVKRRVDWLVEVGKIPKRSVVRRKDGHTVRVEMPDLDDLPDAKHPSEVIDKTIKAIVPFDAPLQIVSNEQFQDAFAIMLQNLANQKSDNVRLSIQRYLSFCKDRGHSLIDVDLKHYRDYLLYEKPNPRKDKVGIEPAAVKTELSNIRARYTEIVKDNSFLHWLMYSVYRRNDNMSMAEFADMTVRFIENAIDAKQCPVEVVAQSDETTEVRKRLTGVQAERLLSKPGLDNLQAIRDTAIMATMLCTGLRRFEIIALDVRDLRVNYGGEVAIEVREGKGCKQRVVPWGDLEWCLEILNYWMRKANITDGAVFRGLYRNQHMNYYNVRPSRLSLRSMYDINERYPIIYDGQETIIVSHDLRATYARLQFLGGMDPKAIQDNMGHTDIKETYSYIGPLDAKDRRGKSTFSFRFEVPKD